MEKISENQGLIDSAVNSCVYGVTNENHARDTWISYNPSLIKPGSSWSTMPFHIGSAIHPEEFNHLSNDAEITPFISHFARLLSDNP